VLTATNEGAVITGATAGDTTLMATLPGAGGGDADTGTVLVESRAGLVSAQVMISVPALPELNCIELVVPSAEFTPPAPLTLTMAAPEVPETVHAYVKPGPPDGTEAKYFCPVVVLTGAVMTGGLACRQTWEVVVATALAEPAALLCVQLMVSVPVVGTLRLIVTAVPPKVPLELVALPFVTEQAYVEPDTPDTVAAYVVTPAVRFAPGPVRVGGLAGDTKVTVVGMDDAAAPATLVAVLVMATEAADGEVKVMELVEPSDESTPALPPGLVMVPGLPILQE
jgi:hypothetical protein